MRALIPEEDRWALTHEGREKVLREEARRRQLLAERLMEPSSGDLRAAFDAKCAADPEFFWRNCVWTQDPENRVGLGQDLPFKPFTYQLRRRPAPPGFGDGRPIGGWIETWTKALRSGKRARMLHTKSRRARFSISTAGMNCWGLRYWPGWKAIIGSDEEGAVDNAAGDWNSILGKLRYIWQMWHQFFPWQVPALPQLSKTPRNKQGYIKFPYTDDPAFQAVLENEAAGVLPSEISKRGGASLITWLDEAAWIKKLKEFLETVGPMTTILILGSTPSDDMSHPFQQIVDGVYDWPVDVVHHLMDPVLLSGLEWDEHGAYRGPWTQRWRTNVYKQILREEDSHTIARNWDINPQSTAAAPVFVTFDAETQVTSEDPTAKDFDLYDPYKPLYVWADIGWGDPWACWWVQTSDATGEVNLVDYWCRAGVHAEWWLPLWFGWEPDTYRNGKVAIPGGNIGRWRNAPERLPWSEAVPQEYSQEDLDVMRYWRGKVSPKAIILDASGKQHHGATRWSVVERLLEYRTADVWPVSMAHHMEDMISHANMVMRRARIAGRIAKRRPKSGGVTYVSGLSVLTNWRRMESTERGSPAKPLHDQHSHGGTALIYGASQLPAAVDQRGPRGDERIVGGKAHGTRRGFKTKLAKPWQGLS